MPQSILPLIGNIRLTAKYNIPCRLVDFAYLQRRCGLQGVASGRLAPYFPDRAAAKRMGTNSPQNAGPVGAGCALCLPLEVLEVPANVKLLSCCYSRPMRIFRSSISEFYVTQKLLDAEFPEAPLNAKLRVAAIVSRLLLRLIRAPSSSTRPRREDSAEYTPVSPRKVPRFLLINF